jgi:hypothetical protein
MKGRRVLLEAARFEVVEAARLRIDRAWGSMRFVASVPWAGDIRPGLSPLRARHTPLGGCGAPGPATPGSGAQSAPRPDDQARVAGEAGRSRSGP